LELFNTEELKQLCASVDKTRTTTRSCREPETAVSNFWSPGGVQRPQRAAGSGGRRLLLLPPPVQLRLLLVLPYI